MRLGELIRDLPISGAADRLAGVEVTSLVNDSRAVRGGSLFIAVPGARVDARSFIADAIERGAVAVLTTTLDTPVAGPIFQARDLTAVTGRIANRFYGDPSSALKVVGITGTNGKTTTTFLVRSILEAAGIPTAVLGTTGYFIGDRVFDAPNTTPDALLLTELLYRCRRSGIRAAAMEVSSHGLALGRVSQIRFSCGVFTNLTQDHLDFHPTMKDYFAAKARLFTLSGGRGAVNLDDPWGRRLIGAYPDLVTFGTGGAVRVENENFTLEGTSFDLIVRGERVSVRTKLVGRPNISNSLAAAAAAFVLEIPLQKIALGLESAESPPGRFEVIETNGDMAIAVDYAHTPDALERLLQTGREIRPRRLMVLFGCGGDRDRTKRPRMGEIASRLADEVWITSDNPRTEDPDSILDQIESGIPATTAGRCRRIVDRREAIHDAIRAMRKGDLLFIAGKGHEDYQILGTTKFDFDDRKVAREALKAMNALPIGRGSKSVA